MTVVISDTSVLCYLALIGRAELLHNLFGRVIVPEAVYRECLDPRAPEPLKKLFVPKVVPFIMIAPAPMVIEPTEGLDDGEAEAISLAYQNQSNSLLLIDEKRGRAVAKTLGLRVRGLLGVVTEGHRRGHLDFDSTLRSLRTHGFYLADSVIQQARQALLQG